jgi:hypothetical protein
MSVVGYSTKQAVLRAGQRLTSKQMVGFHLSHCIDVSSGSFSLKITMTMRRRNSPGKPPNLLSNGVYPSVQKNSLDFSRRLLPDGYISL